MYPSSGIWINGEDLQKIVQKCKQDPKCLIRDLLKYFIGEINLAYNYTVKAKIKSAGKKAIPPKLLESICGNKN